MSIVDVTGASKKESREESLAFVYGHFFHGCFPAEQKTAGRKRKAGHIANI